jgi:hypothetical protein
MRVIIGLCASFTLQSCGLLQKTPFVGTDELNRNIASNAEVLNDAHADATNAVILKNVLRARDRWPTSYTTLSGVTAQPQVDFTAGGTFTPLGLGNPKGPFTGSSASVEQTGTSAANYTVNPFASDNNGKSLLEPIPDQIFARYWDAGWPKDLLFMLLVDSIDIEGQRFLNDHEDPEEFLAEAAKFMGASKCTKILQENDIPDKNYCAFSNLTYQYKIRKGDDECAEVANFDRLRFLQDRDVGEMGLLAQIEKLSKLDERNIELEFESKGQRIAVKLCKNSKFALLPVSKTVETGKLKQQVFSSRGQTAPKDAPIATIKIRSIASTIYYVGEWLRFHGDHASVDAEVKSGFVVRPSECADDEDANRLFSVFNREILKALVETNQDMFAARVRHAGKTYYAVRRSETSTVNSDSCNRDRSGTVMALLSQLYLRSQDDAFLKAPEASILRTK